MKSLKGILLSNIGTPDSNKPEDVARYLREFLMDEEVLTLPYPLRWPLVNWAIVPKRAHRSAKKYDLIWTPEGSPLMVHSQNLQKNLQNIMGSEFLVELGMRYGNPSIEKALENFRRQDVQEVFVLPLYPQYCRATTESTHKKIDELVAKHNYSFHYRKARSFWSQKSFVDAQAEEAKKHLDGKTVDYYLMTFHGLPESHDGRVEPMDSYRLRCSDTATLLADAMGLSKEQWGISFQSRLGRGAWMRPYTDEVLRALPQHGVKRLAVLCPSFVSDCLETIEEIGMEGRETFLHAGGESFHQVPCLNGRADYLAQFVKSCWDL